MASAAKPASNADFRAMLDAFEESIEALRIAYDKYFTGVDKVAPVRMHESVERKLRDLERQRPLQTVLRFRMSSLRARFVTYNYYWTRVLREMERGVSRRDLLRFARVAKQQTIGGSEAAASDSPASNASNGEVAPSRAERERAAQPAPPLDPAEAGLDPGHLREVFRSLVQAKKAAGESLDGLTYAALVRKLCREAPKVKARHNCNDVRFEVVQEEGKVRLRARPL